MPVRKVLNSRVPVKVWTDDVEDVAAEQLKRTGALPFVFKHVAAMADTHWGLGATVGSVIATKGAVCPAAVGVDIGCGMAAVKTSLSVSALEGKLPRLRASIERGIPVGFHQRKEPHPKGAALLAAAVEADLPAVANDTERKKARAPVRHARRRQPLHRDLRRPGRRPRLGPSALRVPQHRQDHGRAPHLEGQGRDEEARRLPPRSGSRVLRDGDPRVRRLRAGPPVVPGFRAHEPGHHGRGSPQGPAPRGRRLRNRAGRSTPTTTTSPGSATSARTSS